jgi:hypothetical protein
MRAPRGDHDTAGIISIDNGFGPQGRRYLNLHELVRCGIVDGASGHGAILTSKRFFLRGNEEVF